MGQAYSRWNAPGSNGNDDRPNRRLVRDYTSRANTPARAQSSSVRGTAARPQQHQQRATRYSPYTTTPARTTQATESNNAPADTSPASGPAAPHSAAGASPTTPNAGRREGIRRNELLARVIGGSVVNSISQEIERRRLVRDTAIANRGMLDSLLALHSEVRQRLPGYNMDTRGRIGLTYHISLFILAMLETYASGVTQRQQHQEESQSPQAASQQDIAAAGDGDVEMAAASPASAPAAADDGSQETSNASGTSAGAADDAADGSESGSSPASSSSGLIFRMFLMPGAIEQALLQYDRLSISHNPEFQPMFSLNTAPSVPQAAAAAAAATAATAGTAAAETPEGTAQVPSDQSAATDNAQQQPVRPLSLDERRRNSVRHERDERLWRLRQIARAMHDERRDIEVPIAVLGLQMSHDMLSRLAQAENAEPSSFASPDTTTTTAATTSSSSSNNSTASGAHTPDMSESLERHIQATENALSSRLTRDLANAGPQAAGPEQPAVPRLQSVMESLRQRLTSLVPNFVGHLRGGTVQAGQETPDGAGPGSAGTAPASAADTAPASPGDGAPNNAGLSIYVTIQDMTLGNPLLLTMVTYELFPELLQDDMSSTDLQMNLSGGNYELFMEIANIIGEVSSNTVSQEAVDKTLARYRLETRGTAEDAELSVAKLIVGEDDQEESHVDTGSMPAVVHLVSAERCPVCLEDFEVGDILRVLKCHHGLHLVCGDSWFTQGANRCPICRSEAVPIERGK